ncbi:MAG: replication-relaxation family protein [Verrucomicrobiota bacterium]
MPSSTHLPIQLTPRDLQILTGLFEARTFTLQQIATLYFDGRYEAAKKRLQKLKASGHVRPRERHSFQPTALFLTKQGFDAVVHLPALAGYPEISWHRFYKRTQIADSTLLHELAVSDARVQLTLAANLRSDLSLLRFITWPTLIAFEARTALTRDGLTYRKAVTARPDGFFRLRQTLGDGRTRILSFYLEVDRSTEPQRTLQAKALAYQDHFRHSGPFRVLFVFPSFQRLAHTRATFETLNGRKPFILTLSDLLLQTLECMLPVETPSSSS